MPGEGQAAACPDHHPRPAHLAGAVGWAGWGGRYFTAFLASQLQSLQGALLPPPVQPQGKPSAERALFMSHSIHKWISFSVGTN